MIDDAIAATTSDRWILSCSLPVKMFGSLDLVPSGLNLTLDEEDELVKSVVNFLGHRRRDKFAFPLLISLYSFIFATGLTGNLCRSSPSLSRQCRRNLFSLFEGTCFIIWKSRDMHTPTNFYLFSLAVSDLLLISLGKLTNSDEIQA